MNMGCVWISKCGGTILGFGFGVAVFELKTLFFYFLGFCETLKAEVA